MVRPRRARDSRSRSRRIVPLTPGRPRHLPDRRGRAGLELGGARGRCRAPLGRRGDAPRRASGPRLERRASRSRSRRRSVDRGWIRDHGLGPRSPARDLGDSTTAKAEPRAGRGHRGGGRARLAHARRTRASRGRCRARRRSRPRGGSVVAVDRGARPPAAGAPRCRRARRPSLAGVCGREPPGAGGDPEAHGRPRREP